MLLSDKLSEPLKVDRVHSFGGTQSLLARKLKPPSLRHGERKTNCQYKPRRRFVCNSFAEDGEEVARKTPPRLVLTVRLSLTVSK